MCVHRKAPKVPKCTWIAGSCSCSGRWPFILHIQCQSSKFKVAPSLNTDQLEGGWSVSICVVKKPITLEFKQAIVSRSSRLQYTYKQVIVSKSFRMQLNHRHKLQKVCSCRLCKQWSSTYKHGIVHLGIGYMIELTARFSGLAALPAPKPLLVAKTTRLQFSTSSRKNVKCGRQNLFSTSQYMLKNML